jgi:hypothetical protein
MSKLKWFVFTIMLVIIQNSIAVQEETGLFALSSSMPKSESAEVELLQLSADLVRRGESLLVTQKMELYSDKATDFKISSAVMPSDTIIISDGKTLSFAEDSVISFEADELKSIEIRYQVMLKDIVTQKDSVTAIVFCGLIQNISSKNTNIKITYPERFDTAIYSNLPVVFDEEKTVWEAKNIKYNALVAKLSHEKNALLAEIAGDERKGAVEVDLFGKESDDSAKTINTEPDIKERHWIWAIVILGVIILVITVIFLIIRLRRVGIISLIPFYK